MALIQHNQNPLPSFPSEDELLLTFWMWVGFPGIDPLAPQLLPQAAVTAVSVVATTTSSALLWSWETRNLHPSLYRCCCVPPDPGVAASAA
jgi:hypothetical protein